MTAGQATVLYVGVDVHERESQLAVYDSSGRLLMEKRIPTSDLAGFISSLSGEKYLAIESAGFIYPIYDALSKLPSCHVSVANPSSVRLIAETRLKHDRADAKVLGELLRTNFLPLSYIPDEETRERRLLVNDRVKYGLRRADLKISMRWLLKRRGLDEDREAIQRRGEEEAQRPEPPRDRHQARRARAHRLDHRKAGWRDITDGRDQ